MVSGRMKILDTHTKQKDTKARVGRIAIRLPVTALMPDSPHRSRKPASGSDRVGGRHHLRTWAYRYGQQRCVPDAESISPVPLSAVVIDLAGLL